MEDRRAHWIDNLRGGVAIVVVLYHIIYMYNGVQPFGVLGAFREGQPWDGLMYWVYPWFMALLFAVSGLCARYALRKKGVRPFLRERTRKLLVPSTLGLVVFYWMLGYLNMAIGGAFDTMSLETMPFPARHLMLSVMGTGPLWTVQMLWLFSLPAALLYRIGGDRTDAACARVGLPLLALTVPLAWGAAQILNTPVITVYRFGLYGFEFFLGFYVLAQDAVTDRLAKAAPVLVPMAVALNTAYTLIYFGGNYAIEPLINNPLACVCCQVSVLAALGGMKRWGNRTSRVTAWVNRRAWGLYLFHYLTLSAAAWGLKCRYPNAPAWVCYPTVGAAAFLGAFALDALIRRVPVLRYCVMGVKGEKKHVS